MRLRQTCPRHVPPMTIRHLLPLLQRLRSRHQLHQQPLRPLPRHHQLPQQLLLPIPLLVLVPQPKYSRTLRPTSKPNTKPTTKPTSTIDATTNNKEGSRCLGRSRATGSRTQGSRVKCNTPVVTGNVPPSNDDDTPQQPKSKSSKQGKGGKKMGKYRPDTIPHRIRMPAQKPSRLP
mmetsp:Transcript_30396/g.64117  ORF Transcript_30396/g.64117 Transcript_30396/m.64117 type:complete len:176 (-) Transcript_30396:698-1225(-)